MNKPRKPWLAGLLTLLTVGLGHIYAGNAQRGILLFLGQGIILTICLTLFYTIPPTFFLAAVILLAPGYIIFCCIDAVRFARKNLLSYSIKKYNRLSIYILCWALVAIIIQPASRLLIREFFLQAYKIPSGAMIPSLLPGDFLLADKYIYRSSKPQRGDIIIFPSPQLPDQAYLKRLIGREGDLIEIKEKKLYINNQPYVEEYITFTDPRVLPGEMGPRDNFGPITVPPGSFFVLGDNRDNSYDSRFWGFIRAETVTGKVRFLYWSRDTESHRIRWERVGILIR